VKAIAEASRTLPNSVKIMITSRKERDIKAALATAAFSININESEEIDDDILKYVDHRMGEIANSHDLPEGWHDASDKARLTTRAGGLFIWVKVASDFMESSADPRGVLRDILAGQSGSAEEELDKLYLRVLEGRKIKHCSDDEMKHVLGSILVAKVPLTKGGLDSLLGLDGNMSQDTRDVSRIRLTTCASLIDALGPILLVSSKGTIRFLHASIADFFTDSARCTDRFFINRSEYDHVLTIRCFKTMDMLRRDICGINDPTKLNSEIVDLDVHLREHLHEHLRYACIYWSQHLGYLPVGHSDVTAYAKGIFRTHLLHWIEVMSLLDLADHVQLALSQTNSWFQVRLVCLRRLERPGLMPIAQIYTPGEIDLLQVTDEAVHLMRRFGQAIQQSAAHIYVSAVPLTPPSSILYKTYARTLQNIPKLICGNETFATHVHLEGKSALAPDRSWFVYARDGDCKLWIWDVAKAITIDGPLVGHNGAVSGIWFSKDGKKFCSLDAENRVIVWNAADYQTIGVPVQLSFWPADVALCGNKVVVWHEGASVCVWDVVASSLEKEYVEKQYHCVLSPDTQRL